ncbi:MAG: DoxX family protein [Deltaproteobacteria bacterium]|nr:MAG: DoxX family protein [Deltaproteobacteria bacterium]TMQ12537.1 MAG: DoxX family protein [Deltaproteobacteria bacterium]
MMDRSSTLRVTESWAPSATLFIRLAMGFVFITEGIQKFLYPDALGVGRFIKIGIPAPEMTAPFVGVVEIVGGTLVLVGLATRFGAVALLIDMIVAITATKVPILIGSGFWGFAAPSAKPGFWSMAHEARLDISMLLGCAFLIAAGPGTASLDHRRRSA